MLSLLKQYYLKIFGCIRQYIERKRLSLIKLWIKIKFIRHYGLFTYIKQALNCYLNQSKTHDIFFAVCAIAKNETPYIREWIEFHKLVGVEKFFIYDHESTDNLKETLQNYINSGEVVYEYIEGEGAQFEAYKKCIAENRKKVKWMAFIDIDEFLTPIKYNSVPEFIRAFESKIPHVDAIGINWLCHGFNGHYTKPQGLLCENFPKCDFTNDIDRHIKSIVRLNSVITTINPHFFIHKFNSKIVNAIGEDMYGAFTEPHLEEIRINHYWTKSYEQMCEKFKRGWECDSKKIKAKVPPYSPDYLSKDTDYSMDKFVELLKEKLK